jgi:peptidoglycan hydrolase-like protein with peptidoglycan-binding domain
VNTKRILAPLFVVVAVSGLLAACGGSEPAATPTATVTATVTSAASPEPVANERVKLMQAELKEAGFYDGEITGIYDAATEEAIRAAQEAGGITVDGIYGPETHAVLIRVIAGGSAEADDSQAAPPQESEHMMQVQNELYYLSYYTGPIDGIYGAQTEDAIKRFQRASGLTVDGKIGPATDAALSQAVAELRQAEEGGEDGE